FRLKAWRRRPPRHRQAMRLNGAVVAQFPHHRGRSTATARWPKYQSHAALNPYCGRWESSNHASDVKTDVAEARPFIIKKGNLLRDNDVIWGQVKGCKRPFIPTEQCRGRSIGILRDFLGWGKPCAL